MNRRDFIRGISVMALATKLSFTEPVRITLPAEVAERYSRILARSMLRTKEVMAAEVFRDASEYEHVVYGTQMWIELEYE